MKLMNEKLLYRHIVIAINRVRLTAYSTVLCHISPIAVCSQNQLIEAWLLMHRVCEIGFAIYTFKILDNWDASPKASPIIMNGPSVHVSDSVGVPTTRESTGTSLRAIVSQRAHLGAPDLTLHARPSTRSRRPHRVCTAA
jgi:hypothetical protein